MWPLVLQNAHEKKTMVEFRRLRLSPDYGQIYMAHSRGSDFSIAILQGVKYLVCNIRRH